MKPQASRQSLACDAPEGNRPCKTLQSCVIQASRNTTSDGRCEGAGSAFTLNASSEAWSPPEEVKILPRTGRAN